MRTGIHSEGEVRGFRDPNIHTRWHGTNISREKNFDSLWFELLVCLFTESLWVIIIFLISSSQDDKLFTIQIHVLDPIPRSSETLIRSLVNWNIWKVDFYLTSGTVSVKFYSWGDFNFLFTYMFTHIYTHVHTHFD